MAIYLYTFLLWAALWPSVQAQTFVRDPSSTPGRIVHIVVEKRPEFPGGSEKLTQYLRKNSYRAAACRGAAESRVFLNFIVSETGSLEEVRVLKGINPQIDAEALSLVQAMPKWIPARNDGRSVACRVYLPVRFAVPTTSSYKAMLLRIIR
jgi:protein TonB